MLDHRDIDSVHSYPRIDLDPMHDYPRIDVKTEIALTLMVFSGFAVGYLMGFFFQ